MGRSKIIGALLGVLTVIAVGATLKAAESVVLPLIIAWLLSYILGPVVNAMTRRGVPTPLAVTVLLALLLGVCYLAAVFLYARVSVFVNAYPSYENRLTELIQGLARRLDLGGADPLAGVNWGREIGGFLLRLSGSVVSFMSGLLMVIVFLVFLLLGKPYSKYKIRKAFSPERAEQVTTVLSSISRQIGGYLSTQLLISLVTGVLVWLALTILQVDFAVTWGALAFFLNFIPTLGSVVASIPPVLVALIQFPTMWHAVITAIAMLTIQMVLGNVITPKVMGDKLNLSPVVVLLSLVFWGWLWGVAGALLSVPLACAMKIVCETIGPLQPIAVVMGSGRRYRDEFGKD